MSFAGHVFDMIRRDKAYRDDRKRRRDRTKGRNLYMGGGIPSNVTLEELEEINKQTKKRENQQEHYFTRMKFIVLGVIVIITLLLFVVLIHLF